MAIVTTDQLHRLAPNAKAEYVAAFVGGEAVLSDYGPGFSNRRLRHFMAQVLHETGGLTVRTESMNYSTAGRIQVVWPNRFPTPASAEPYVHQPEALANKVYGGRMGNVNPGDGWKFIGRGLIQVTGRESYERFGHLLGVDLAADPDLAFSSQWALKIACAEWQASNCNEHADADDIVRVTRAINGGEVGLPERRQWLVKTKVEWPD